ncbi:MAG: DUF6270 domain-containing protein [Bacillota bacterium]
MILYQAYHLGNIVRVITHRLTVHKNEPAILMAGYSHLGGLKDKIKNLQKLGIFDEVYLYYDGVGYTAESETECEQSIIKYFDSFFVDNKIDINSFDAIYSGVDTFHSFAVYLAMKKKHYFFYELPKNFFEFARRRVATLPKIWQSYADVMIKYGAADGDTPYCTKIISPLSNYIEGAVIFDFANKADEISNEYKKKLIFFFGEIKPKKGTYSLLLTSSQWLIRDYPNVKQYAAELYQTYVDYFIKENNMLMIKPHPLSRIDKSDCEKYFEDALVVNPSFPSDYLRIVDGFKANQVLSTVSASTHGIFEKSEDVTTMVGDQIYYHFNILHKLNVAIDLGFCINNNIAIIYCFGISYQLVENMVRRHEKFKYVAIKNYENDSSLENSLLIVDDLYAKDIKKANKLLDILQQAKVSFITCFINSQSNFAFCNAEYPEILDCLTNIKISKTATKTNTLASLKDEFLYVCFKNLECDLSKYKLNKHLKYLGIDIEASKAYLYEEVDFNKRIANNRSCIYCCKDFKGLVNCIAKSIVDKEYANILIVQDKKLQEYNVSKYFSKVIYLPKFLAEDGSANNLSDGECVATISRYLSKEFASMQLDIRQVTSIVIASKYTDFAIYLKSLSINYTSLTSTTNQSLLSQQIESDKSKYPLAFSLRSKYNLYKECESSNYVSYLELLRAEQKNALCMDFGLSVVNNKEYGTIIEVDGEYVCETNPKAIALLCDYYGKGTKLLRLNSSMREANEYKKYIKNIDIISTEESDILGYNMMPSVSANVKIYLSKEFGKSCNALSLDKRYIDLASPKLIQFDVANEIRKGLFQDKHFSRVGIFNHLMDLYPQSIFNGSTWIKWAEHNQYVIMDELCWRKEVDGIYECIKMFSWMHNIYVITKHIDEILAKGIHLLDNIIPIIIRKVAISEKCVYDLEDEYIYIYSHNQDDLNKIKNFSFKRTLLCCGIEFSAEPLSEDKLELFRLRKRQLALDKDIAYIIKDIKQREVRKKLGTRIDIMDKEMQGLVEFDGCFNISHVGYEPYSFNILGCCIPRDVFGFCDIKKKYSINKFVSFQNPIVTHLNPKSIKITLDEEVLLATKVNRWKYKCSVHEINNTGLMEILSNKSEYILIDLGDIRHPIRVFGEGDTKILTSNTMTFKQLEPHVMKEKTFNVPKETVKSDLFDLNLIENAVKHLAISIMQVYPKDKIIVLDAYPVDKMLNREKWTIESYHYSAEISPEATDLIEPTTNLLCKYLGDVARIKMLSGCLGQTVHKWGPHRLHYFDEYYQYAFECIEQYTESGNKDFEKIKTKYEKTLKEIASKIKK